MLESSLETIYNTTIVAPVMPRLSSHYNHWQRSPSSLPTTRYNDPVVVVTFSFFFFFLFFLSERRGSVRGLG